MVGGNLWISLLVVENLDDTDQFILGPDFVRNFEVFIDLNNGLIRIRNPDRKFVKRPVNSTISDENKIPNFLERKLKLQPRKPVVATFRMRFLNTKSDSKQVCLAANPCIQISMILDRSFSVTQKRAVCECIVEYTGKYGFIPAVSFQRKEQSLKPQLTTLRLTIKQIQEMPRIEFNRSYRQRKMNERESF